MVTATYLDRVKIGNEYFNGIGYQGLLTVNTKTYVESPSRSNDGSIANINDHDVFFVPRCKLNFKYFKIEDYQRLLNEVSGKNEFPVEYFDKQTGTMVSFNMYIEPEEMAKLYNVGTSIIGVLDYEVSLIGTRNNLPVYTVTYYKNASSSDQTVVGNTESAEYGTSIVVKDGGDVTPPTGYTFVCWNTKRDGSGLNFYSNNTNAVFSDLSLYAQWSAS